MWNLCQAAFFLFSPSRGSQWRPLKIPAFMRRLGSGSEEAEFTLLQRLEVSGSCAVVLGLRNKLGSRAKSLRFEQQMGLNREESPKHVYRLFYQRSELTGIICTGWDIGCIAAQVLESLDAFILYPSLSLFYSCSISLPQPQGASCFAFVGFWHATSSSWNVFVGITPIVGFLFFVKSANASSLPVGSPPSKTKQVCL